MRASFALLAMALLAACGPATQSGRDGAFLRGQGPVANPSAVVATELAFARAAREDGQWTAFREFAADGAMIFGRQGAFEAEPWLKAQDNPAQSVQWEPHAVWSSCDGSLAITRFAYRDPNDGSVGQGHTVWARQRDRSYRWLFDFGWPTDEAIAEPEAISAIVAQCPTGEVPRSITADARRSGDGSLQWTFAFTGTGTREFRAWSLGESGMEQVIDIAIPPKTDGQ